MNSWRRLIVGLGAACLVVGTAGAAFAVSSGGYSPSQQDCPANADAFNAGQPGSQVPAAVTRPKRCSNFKLNVEDAKGHRYAEFGIDQIPNGSNKNAQSGTYRVNTNSDGSGPGVSGTYDTHYQPIPPGGPSEFGLAFYPVEVVLCEAAHGPGAACVFTPNLPNPKSPPSASVTPHMGTPDGSIADLATGASIYLGADDNLDTSEHDGVDGKQGTKGSANGPSDGGAVVFNWHPLDLTSWLAAAAGNPSSVLTNPVPVADGGGGACADGICFSAQTRQRTVYKGCGANRQVTPKNGCRTKSRDVYNYDGKQWDPQQCSSGDSKGEAACRSRTHSGMDQWREAEAQNVVAEPGVQVYEDPDPEGSPLGPYPLPAAYVGTCGVAAGGGPVTVPAGTPMANREGQVIVSTGC
jgi:hypothetical protein